MYMKTLLHINNTHWSLWLSNWPTELLIVTANSEYH